MAALFCYLYGCSRKPIALYPLMKRFMSAKFDVKCEFEPPKTMKCFELQSYAKTLDELRFVDHCDAPKVSSLQPDQCLVKVMAASVNPIDIEMSTGYGRKLAEVFRKRQGKKEFPLILGADFSGVLVGKGKNITKHQVGDEVWGVRHIAGLGTHAQYTIVEKKGLTVKPKNLDHIQAASIPYVACTTWNALCHTGLLAKDTGVSQRVFVPAGTGGIGSFAIQLLKSYGHYVVTTCSTAGLPLVQTFGADCVIDYTSETYWRDLQNAGPFDVIFDTLREKHKSEFVKCLRGSVRSKYVSLRSTLLTDIDKHGLGKGLVAAGSSYIGKSITHFLSGKGRYLWGFFSPNASYLDNILPLVEAGRLKPVVDCTFDISDAISAYMHVANGHTRGKTVIRMF